MLELIQAGGWLMVPILPLSVVALAIVLERLWVLRRTRIMPEGLVGTIRELHAQGQLTPERLAALREGSPLGRILVAGLVNRHHSRQVMQEAIEGAGRQAIVGGSGRPGLNSHAGVLLYRTCALLHTICRYEIRLCPPEFCCRIGEGVCTDVPTFDQRNDHVSMVI